MSRDITAVLDTNVVLDWLVFGNPGVQPLVAAIESGRVRWLASIAMREELADVLARPYLAGWQPDMNRVWQAWDRFAMPADSLPALTGPALRLKCSDPDDQKFVELALAASRWLVSRDRAVLKLARRSAPLGVHVLTPEVWSKEHG